MSNAILALCQVGDAQPGVAASLLTSLVRAVNGRTPLERIAITITPEVAFIETRAEAIERFRGLGLHKFALAILRRKTRRDELLIIAVGDDGPTLRTIAIGPVRYALAGVPLTENDGKNKLWRPIGNQS